MDVRAIGPLQVPAKSWDGCRCSPWSWEAAIPLEIPKNGAIPGSPSTPKKCATPKRLLARVDLKNKTGRQCPSLFSAPGGDRRPNSSNLVLVRMDAASDFESHNRASAETKVSQGRRALIANLDDTAALRAQVSENTGRRDLSYIERALFAQELLDSGFGSQAQIAEVLNVTRSAVSMSISVAKAIGTALAHAIGPAHGVGRPRWEALAKELADSRIENDDLSRIALDVRAKAAANEQADEDPQVDPSVAAFEAVARHVKKSVSSTLGKKPRSKTTALVIDGTPVGAIKISGRALRLDLTDVDDAFAEWLDARAQDVLEELHDRWKGET